MAVHTGRCPVDHTRKTEKIIASKSPKTFIFLFQLFSIIFTLFIFIQYINIDSLEINISFINKISLKTQRRSHITNYQLTLTMYNFVKKNHQSLKKNQRHYFYSIIILKVRFTMFWLGQVYHDGIVSCNTLNVV